MTLQDQFSCEAPDQPVHSLEEHCSILGDVLSCLALVDSGPRSFAWAHAGDWLDLAAGVKHVEIVTGLFDDSTLYCGSALDFENSRSKAVSEYHTELTRFLFAWGAFETVVDMVRPPGWKYGKIRAVGRFLVSRFDPEKLVHYFCAISNLRKTETLLERSVGMSASNYAPDANYGESGIGIRIVYGLRNSLSHGSLTFPIAESNQTHHLEVRRARLATRVVLMTAQMVISAHFRGVSISLGYRDQAKEQFDNIEFNGDVGEVDAGACDVSTLVKKVHLRSVSDIRT